MKRDLGRDLIEGLRDSTNVEFVENLNLTIFSLVDEAFKALSQKSSFIQADKVYFMPVNEVSTHAMTSQSVYSYFLGVANTEIELNSLDKKHYLKNLWKRFKRAWTLARKKKRKKKKVEVEQIALVTKEKYTIDDLRSDIVLNISKFLTDTSIVYEYYDHISIIGKEDFGSNIKIDIYIAMYDEKNAIFKLYDNKKNRYYNVSFSERFRNVKIKSEECENFINMIKIYNSLFAKAYSKVPNQILIESLLFNCPNALFEKDLYQTFLNVSNYIRMTDADAMRSICDNSKSIFKEKLIVDVGAQVEFMKLIRLLDAYKI